jgi:hypothetical protein
MAPPMLKTTSSVALFYGDAGIARIACDQGFA